MAVGFACNGEHQHAADTGKLDGVDGAPYAVDINRVVHQERCVHAGHNAARKSHDHGAASLSPVTVNPVRILQP